MEINRDIKVAPPAAVDASTAPREKVEQLKPQAKAEPAKKLALEKMQQALLEIPDVDLDKVNFIKQALQRGDIPLDTVQLARSVLAYHRGNDA